MANTPVNVFSQYCDPDQVLEALKDLLPECTVVPGPNGTGWSSATGIWKRGLLKSALKLKVTHDPSYYAGEGWPTQLSGMDGFFRRFPDAANRPDLFDYIPGLCFAVSFILDPAPVEKDPRQTVIFQIARFVEGVIFLPHSLLDAEGRAIVSIDGQSDPEAQLPAHEVQEVEASDTDDADSDTMCDPPTEERVIARLILMAALVNRGFMESHPDDEPRRQDIVENLSKSPAWSTG